MKLNRRIALYALALWMQLVFGLGMTLWRDTLTLSGNWQIYMGSISHDLNGFTEFASQNTPPREIVGYLTPPSDDYLTRYARLAIELYPRRVVWLGNGPAESPITAWTSVDVRDSNWVRVLEKRDIRYVLIEGLADAVPCQQNCVRFDETRSLWVVK